MVVERFDVRSDLVAARRLWHALFDGRDNLQALSWRGLLLPIEVSYPVDSPFGIPGGLEELLVSSPQLAVETIGERQIVGVVGGSLTESTRDLQRPAVKIPRLMQRDLGGQQVSDKVNCPFEAQLAPDHSPVERV